MTKKISPRLRLTETNPTTIKVEKLCAYAEEIGITLTFGNQKVIVHDRESNLPTIEMVDIEGGHNWFDEFPPSTEYKLICDNPKYLEIKAQEEQEYQAKRKQEQAEALKLLEEQKRIEEGNRAKVKEKEERDLLAQLKSKYEQ